MHCSQVNSSREQIIDQSISLVINEYLADPPDGSAGDANGDGRRDSNQDEFIELVNAGASPLSIGGFTISDSTQVRFIIPSGKTIPAGEAVVVFGGGSASGSFGNAAANGLVFIAGGAGLSLNNGGDSIIVKDSLGAEVAKRDFAASDGSANQSITRSPDVSGAFVQHSSAPDSDGALFSPGTLINGRAFVTDDPSINGLTPSSIFAGEQATLTITGRHFTSGSRARIDGVNLPTRFTSGTELSADVDGGRVTSGVHAVTVQNADGAVSNAFSFTVLGEIGINEYLADPPDGLLGDANGDGLRDSSHDEFVEMVNRTDAAVDIGGYSISDADQTRFIFPLGTVIPSGEVAVVFGGGSPRGSFGNASANGLVFVAALSLSNGGDRITLKNAGGQAVETISFTAAEGNAAQSINRNPDLTGATFLSHSSVQGSSGRLFSPGARVNGSAFTVAPRISQISPDRVARSNSSFLILVQGEGFAGSTVLIDSTPVLTVQVSQNHLSATVPASIAGTAGEHGVQVRNDGGNRSNALLFTITPPPPVLSQLAPGVVVAGSSASTIFVLGSEFSRSCFVQVEGASVVTVFVNSNEIKATLPSNLLSAVGSLGIRVRSGEGQESNELRLRVIPAAVTISALAPATVITGGPEFTIGLTGTNFKTGAVALLDRVPLPTRFVSSSKIEALVPADSIALPGLRSVAVVNPDGSESNESVLRVLPVAPVIRSITPERAVEGSGELRITLRGEKFQKGASIRVIRNGGPTDQLETSFNSVEELNARVTENLIRVAGKLLLRVDNPDFGISNTMVFEILLKDALVINEFLADPPEGPMGDANGDGNRSSAQDEFIELVNRTASPMDISGFKIFDSESVRHTFASGTVIPPHEAVLVFGGGTPRGDFGNLAENKLVFTASTGGLSLGNGGDVIRLQKPGGDIIQEIRFGPDQGSADQSVNREPDVDGALLLPHTSIVEDLSRVFSPGTRVNGEPFTVKPRVTATNPSSVRAGAAEFVLKVHGSNLMSGAVLLFGTVALETTYQSSETIEAQVSAGLVAEGGSVELRVRNPRGELSSAIKFVIVGDPPRITSISPHTTGTGAEQFDLTVMGEGFQLGATLSVQGETVETQVMNSRSVIARLPERFFSAARTFDIQVMNGDGNRSNVERLTVENGPLITRVPRARIKAGAGAVRITIGGLAFKSGIVLLVNGAAVPTDYVGETELSAQLSPDMTNNPATLTLQARNADGGRSNRVTIRVVP